MPTKVKKTTCVIRPFKLVKRDSSVIDGYIAVIALDSEMIKTWLSLKCTNKN